MDPEQLEDRPNRLCCPECGSPAIFPSAAFGEDVRCCQHCGLVFDVSQGIREDAFRAPADGNQH